MKASSRPRERRAALIGQRALGALVLMAVLAGCGRFSLPHPSTLAVAVAGQPEQLPFGGYRVEVTLTSAAGERLGPWPPDAGAGRPLAPGAYVLTIVVIGRSDVNLCVGPDQPDNRNCRRDEFPPVEVCRVPLAIPPSVEVVLTYRLDRGPVCVAA